MANKFLLLLLLLSDYFLATHGVGQGGVLSPVLFCVYIDGLLTALASAMLVATLVETTVCWCPGICG